jgi:hypothetical protein
MAKRSICFSCGLSSCIEGLGPLQEAKTIPGITTRQIAFINQRHITAEKLDAAIREVINAITGTGVTVNTRRPKFTKPRYEGLRSFKNHLFWRVF